MVVGGPRGGPLTNGPGMPNQWQQQNAVQNQAAAATPSSPFAQPQAAGNLSANMHVPAVAETVEVESQSSQLATQSQTLDASPIDARQVTDALFAIVKPEFLYERPIRERHRIVFYIGHLEAFDRNLRWRHVQLPQNLFYG